MKKQNFREGGIFKIRVLTALALCSVGASLGILSFARATTSTITAAAPGFRPAATVPGSAGGGNESYVGIAFTGPRAGNRVQAWQGATRFNVSTDGVNWNFATGQTPGTSGGGDVSTAVDAFGAYYIAEFCTATQGELQACIHKSTDGGTTWTTTTIANVSPNPIDRPWIDVYPKLAPTATITSTAQTRVYLEYHTFTDGQTYLNSSTNGGASFGPPTPAAVGTNSALPDSNCNTVPSGVFVDQRNGTVYALWLSGDDVAQDIVTGCNITQIGPFNKAWVTKSTNDGLTWMIPSTGPAWTGFFDPTTFTGDNANKLFGSIAVDYAGQVHVLVTARKKDQPVQYVVDCNNPNASCVENKADTDLVFTTSPDGGVHWTAPRDINLVHDTDNNPDTNPHTYFYPWIFGGAKGMVNAIYYFAPTARPNDTAPATNSWVTKVSQITDAIANPPGVGGCPAEGPVPIPPAPACYVGAGPQVAQETLVSANTTNPTGVIHVGQICTFGIFCDLVTGGDRSLLDSNNIAIDPAGGVYADWTANANPTSRRVEFVCQNSGRSLFDGANAPEPFAGGSAVLNGCYGPTDMSITKTHSPQSVPPGGTLTYHLTVTNNGMPTMPATTSGVVVTDVLPAGVSFVSATPSSGTCSGTSTITCNLGIFPSGATATVDIVVNAPNTTGNISNTASVVALTSDPNLSNNSVTDTANVSSLVLNSVVSRKIHSTTPYDIAMPVTGTPGVECRGSGSVNDYTLVFKFSNLLSNVGGATVSAHNPGGATGTVSSSMIDPSDHHNYIVNLTNVSTGQYLTVTLTSVNDGVTNVVGPQIGVLVGDASGNGVVTNADVSLVKAQVASGGVVTSSNFRTDINANGAITNADISLAKAQVAAGAQLP